jgi:protein-disulfide isomerase
MNRSVCIALACLVVAGTAPFAVAETPEESLAKYYRKKNNVPAQAKVTVQGLKDSTNFKGNKEGTIAIGEGPGAKSVGFVASPDLKWVVFGDLVDTSVDPAKLVMAKIDLKNQPFEGAKDAKVTIVKYSDFQCPFCKRGYDTIENQVLKQYDGKVKYYFKNYPLNFHPWAEPSAVAAECAKQQKAEAFWKVYKGYFENQQSVNPQNVKDKGKEFLQGTGIDMAKWEKCYDTKETLPQVKAEMAEGAALGVTGTPAFFVNGRMLVGAQPFEKFKDIIDDELASAK